LRVEPAPGGRALYEVRMSDGDALLAAILAEPDEDVPRLVYADWLDEVGDESDRARAELIRVQIELARLPAGEAVRSNPRAQPLFSREQILLTKRLREWLAPLKQPGEPLNGNDAHGLFRRGFVEVVWMPAAWFVARAERLFSCAPARELRVTRTTVEELAALVGSAYFPRLNALDTSDRRLGDDVVKVLTRRSTVAALSTLRLRGCGLTDAAAHRLADADFDWCPTELDVKYNPISAAGLAALRGRYGEAAVRASHPAG
jgi:uncharacterized protein (TIGR02996 family)